MGASGSKIEDDKSLQLCSERKKFVKQALDGRCSIAISYVNYIQSLRNAGTALTKFVKPEVPPESSLCTSTTATPELLALTEKSQSQFSFSPPTLSQHVGAAETFSPSPPYSGQFQANHMRFRGSLSRKVEEKPHLAVSVTVTSSSTPQSSTPRSNEIPEPFLNETDRLSNRNPPWDYFVFHRNENQFPVQDGGRLYQQLEDADDIRGHREEEGIPELEDEINNNNISVSSSEESLEFEDEFDAEPAVDTLVRSFENLNRAPDHVEIPSSKSVASENELLNHKKGNSSNSSLLKDTSIRVSVPTDVSRTPVKEDLTDSKVAPEDFYASMKYIEDLFHKASDCGKEVLRMLEANTFHFHPIVPRKQGESTTSTIFKACFSCGEDQGSVLEELPQTAIRYLAWHRTTSSCSSLSKNLLGSSSKDDMEDLNGDIFQNFCMNSGSHTSTLDRLYAWERKLYDEVKASKIVRRNYDMKCKMLRQLESEGASSYKIDKVRAVVKDLHSRIGVAVHRIEHISKKIEELRDKELQPQLEELIAGLSQMWKEMSKCHKLQHNAISLIHGNSSVRISIQSESHRQITVCLENALGSLSSSFMKWIGALKFYLEAINGWLVKCVPLAQKASKKKRKAQAPSLRNHGPPIYTTCDVWLERLKELPTKEVVNSIKGLAMETSHFLPHQEKASHVNIVNNLHSNASNAEVSILREESSEDWTYGFDRFRSSLVGFLGQLSNFAESSKKTYEDLENDIAAAKVRYEQLMKAYA